MDGSTSASASSASSSLRARARLGPKAEAAGGVGVGATPLLGPGGATASSSSTSNSISSANPPRFTQPLPKSTAASDRLRLHSHRSQDEDALPALSLLLIITSWASSLCRRLFASFGWFISSYQIPALLVSGLLICSLLCPALLLYFSPTGPVPLASSPIARRGRGEFVWELEGLRRQGIIASEDEVCWDRFVRYYQWRNVEAKIVRMEQLLVSSVDREAGAGSAQGGPGVGLRRSSSAGAGVGALTKATLHRAMQLQNELERRLLDGQVPGLSCIRDHRGRCAVASPVEWWDSEQALLADPDVHNTISGPSPNVDMLKNLESNQQARMVPLTNPNTLVGIGRNRKGLAKHAHHLAITFYLEDASNHSSAESPLTLQGVGSVAEEKARSRARATWKRAVGDVVGGKGWKTNREQVGIVVEGKGPGKRVTLKHLPRLSVPENPRLLEDIIYALSYLAVFIYVTRAIRRLPQVNSPSGLILTGTVELTASGIMSLSVCWLFNWSFALVPWNLCAFLVLVCGVDNMLLWTHAVAKTNIRLSVPERIAAALAEEGPAASMVLAYELSICALMRYFINIQVMREIILVIIVVLIVDFFLELTFFATILSIDLQRLELADLLRGTLSSARQQPPTPSEAGDHEVHAFASKDAAHAPHGMFAKAFARAKRTVLDRPAAMTTFLLLFLIDFNLYLFYGPDHFLPAFCSETALASHRPLLAPSLSREIARSLQLGQRGETSRLGEVVPEAGAAFWRLINPANASSAIHVYVEPASIVRFFDDGMVAPESASIAGAAIVSTPWWITAGIVIAPIAVTLMVLYLLLLYLLKDAELLQIQRLISKQQRQERKEAGRLLKKAVPEANVSVTTLHTGLDASDIELVASSADAIVTWSALEERVYLWRSVKQSPTTTTSFLEIPLAAEPPSLVALALDSTTRFCAAATMTGRILVWELERRLLIDFSSADGDSNAVFGPATGLFAAPASSPNDLGQSAPPRTSQGSDIRYAFISIHQSGAVIAWDCVTRLSTVILGPQPVPETSDLPSALGRLPRIRQLVVAPPRASSATAWPVLAQFFPSSGQFQLLRSTSRSKDATAPWETIWNVRLPQEGDTVTAVAFGRFEVGLGALKMVRNVVCLGFLGGSLAVHLLPEESEIPSTDAASTPVALLTLELNGPVRQIRLAPGAKANGDKCAQCGHAISDGFYVVASTTSTVFVDRTFSPPPSGCSSCSGVFGIASRAAVSSAITRNSSQGSLYGGTVSAKRTPKKSLRRPSQASLEAREAALAMGSGRAESRRASVQGPRPSLPFAVDLADAEDTKPKSGNGSSMDSSSSDGLALALTASTGDTTADTSSPGAQDIFSALDDSSIPSSSPADVPLFNAASGLSVDSSTPATCRLHAIEASRCANDQRGGWDLVDRSVIGLRRQRQDESSASTLGVGPLSWAVWSVGLQIGAQEGNSELDSLLARSESVSVSMGEYNACNTPLRRGNHTPATQSSTAAQLRRNVDHATPSVRFESETLRNLPFSRARPIVTIFGDGALAVGLANQVALIRRKGMSLLGN
ncbi:BZ3500_MvSof-1268-A1-R1_Chr4-4g07536 [Microbotryum saponariae]|uniref:BZ3500_MvSof-1268-A1-R1_Chr4-4g07536 protein n=1 Tax=Microbotryum saponariae TaxID=289078 RepID=A0A2X0MQR0_9BASI|nr:BZ3500_MvSof-1268-A1-R1_Chr4-4g07536 [Microbotryum saponariae]SDA07197.1 BZ3501_MvSof-1269-A2-R1_Chr4-3g07244 [Microbotryum saponariae]